MNLYPKWPWEFPGKVGLRNLMFSVIILSSRDFLAGDASVTIIVSTANHKKKPDKALL